MLSTLSHLEDETLVAELHRLGVRHLARFSLTSPSTPIEPVDLLCGLAQHSQARFRTSLILLFLRQPKFNTAVASAVNTLPVQAANTLKLYYQAAVYLQHESEVEFQTLLGDEWQTLPDYFSPEFEIPPTVRLYPAQALDALAAEHTRRTGLAYNWRGAYQQNVPLLIKHLKHDQHHH